MKPKISICIPTFNRADLIGITLQCVAKQTVKPDEVIIIDNASTDNTEEIVKTFAKYGFKYIRNKKNIGMANNYNRCVELTSNEYFTFLPSDDLIAPNWYEEWTNVIAQNKADLYTSPLTVINNEYRPIWRFPLFDESSLIKQPNVMKTMCSRFTPGLPPSAATIYRKSIFAKIGPFDPDEGTECDLRPALKLFDMCDLYYYHQYLFFFREHEQRSFDSQKEARETKFYKRLEHHCQIIHDVYRKRYKNNDDYRYILHTNIFMNLCNINLYAARLEFIKIIRSYQICLKYFPDLFKKAEDWPAFARYQFEFIKRALKMNKISTVDTPSFLQYFSSQD